MGLIQEVQGLIPGKTINPKRGQSSLSAAGNLAMKRGVGAAGAAGMAGVRAAEEALGFRFDPAPTYLFFVELSGLLVALFTKCSGIKVSRDIDEFREGGLNNYAHKLPGVVKYENLTLERGLTMSRALWDWCQQGRYDFQVRRLNFSIIQGAPGHNLITGIGGGALNMSDTAFGMLGKGFGKVKHWDVENAYPVSWSMSDLDASNSETVAIETLEIAHHGLTLSYEVGTPMSIGASLTAAAFG